MGLRVTKVQLFILLLQQCVYYTLTDTYNVTYCIALRIVTLQKRNLGKVPEGVFHVMKASKVVNI